MIKERDIDNIFEVCSSYGYSIKMRDLAYAVLCKSFADKSVAYRCLYPSVEDEDEFKRYDSSTPIMFLKSQVEEMLESDGVKSNDDISFQENKAYMLTLKEKTEKAVENGEMSKKDGYKILASLTTALNDKFNVVDNSKEQMVVVNEKFNAICPYCQHEISVKDIE